MERVNTDDVLKSDVASAERDADDVVDHAREVADAVLSSARDKADDVALGPQGSAAADAVVGERAKADRTVRGERASADVTLRSDRKAQADMLAALLVHERAATDAYLLTERARADDAVEHRDDFLGMVAHDLRERRTPRVRCATVGRQRSKRPANPSAEQLWFLCLRAMGPPTKQNDVKGIKLKN